MFYLYAMIKNKIILRNTITGIIFILAWGIMFSACKKTEDPGPPIVDEEGLTQEVRKLISEEYLKDLKDLGFIVHGGNKPPVLEGSYISSPHILQSSNIENDYYIGSKFADLKFSFLNQNNAKLTLEYRSHQLETTGSGIGGFITGSNNSFTAYFEVVTNKDGEEVKSVEIFTGEIEDGGIKNYQKALLVTQEGSTTIKNGSIRIFKDNDGLAERTNSTTATIPEGFGLLLPSDLLTPSSQ